MRKFTVLLPRRNQGWRKEAEPWSSRRSIQNITAAAVQFERSMAIRSGGSIGVGRGFFFGVSHMPLFLAQISRLLLSS